MGRFQVDANGVGQWVDEVPARQMPVVVQRADSIYNQLTGLGSPGDKGAAGIPSPYVMRLADHQLTRLYGHNGLVRKIVDLLPRRATRKGWEAPDMGQAEDRRLRTWPRCCQAMQLGRLYGGASMMMVTEDDVPRGFRGAGSRWLSQPLDLTRVGKLVNLVVFDPYEAQIQEYDRDVTSPTYRQPLLWSVGADGFSATVHHSRMIHFRGSLRPPSQLHVGRMPDDSVIQAIYDEIARLVQTAQAGAVLAQELRQAAVTMGELPTMMVGDEALAVKQKLKDIALGKSLLNMILLAPGDTYESTTGGATGFKELSEAQKEMLCTVLDWPMTLLNGQAPGGLDSNDEAGLERERQVVSDYAESQREPLEKLCTVMYAQQDGPTKGVIPDEWELTFNPLDEPKEEKIAALRKTVAETDQIYFNIGAYGPEEIAESRFGEEGWQLELEPVPVPDPIEEAELEGEKQRIIAEALPEPAPVRQDATDGVCVLLPAAEPGLRSEVERAIGQGLVSDPAHVTVLYLGGPLDGAELAEVVTAVADEARDIEARTLEHGKLRAFPHGPNGTPIVVEYDDAWPLASLHERLLRRLAHVVKARQHPRYRAHLTIGYAAQPLTPEAAAALLGLDAGSARIPVVDLRVMVGRKQVASVQVGG